MAIKDHDHTLPAEAQEFPGGIMSLWIKLCTDTTCSYMEFGTTKEGPFSSSNSDDWNEKLSFLTLLKPDKE